METVKIGIFMEDRLFAKALAVGLARECRSMAFRILDREEDGKDMDLVLAEDPCAGPNVVRLVRDSSETRLDEPPYSLYRYLESQNMVKDLIRIYFEMTGRVILHRGSRKCQLMCFVSGGGGWGVTSTAISVCRALMRLYGCRCLYLNLCPIDDSKKYLSGQGNTNLLKLLYYLQQDRTFPLEGFITGDEELDYVDTRVFNHSCDEMDMEIMGRLLEKAEALGRYDFVAVDMGNHLSRRNRQILSHADIVAELLHGSPLGNGKYFSSIAREIERLAEHSRLIRIETFFAGWQEELDDDVLAISEDRELFRADGEQCRALELSKNYGLEISAVARRIMEEQSHGET